VYLIAFTLGIFGSLHCLGMCGPLAMTAQTHHLTTRLTTFYHAISYNLGRTLGYMFLGIIFGIFGSVLAFAGLQKLVSIGLGIVLILMFLFSVQPDNWISKNKYISKVYFYISKSLGQLLKKTKTTSGWSLGILNGFLPCGLVYLALAGAISLQNVWGSMGFMLFFGFGTLPAMFMLMMSSHWLKPQWRLSLKKLYPVITLCMGAYLLYRGIFSSTPIELNFIEALQNPIMCH